MFARNLTLALWLLLSGLQSAVAAPVEGTRPRDGDPSIVLITIDTLRVDRVSAYGYSRQTTPNIDALLSEGARFDEARVPEPLTAPAMTSMLTSLHPHEHGATRNGLRMRPRLASLPSLLEKRGYKTAAFVGNWTLKDQLSGLGEHFLEYSEVFSRKRWFGLWFSEATADDLTQASLDWIEGHLEISRRPFFVWIHYVEPHAPYRFHSEFASKLGITDSRNLAASDRYDTEIAFVDASIGRLLEGLHRTSRPINPIIVVTADHGESLGEHGYWGHGRHLFDATLHVPMGLVWRGEIEPSVIDAPSSILDLAPTLLGFIEQDPEETFRGYDWSSVLYGENAPPTSRVTLHQAHKGAVQGKSNANARRRGLLEVARIADQQKETLRIRNGKGRWLFDLVRDSGEIRSLVDEDSKPSADLLEWLGLVNKGLTAADELPAPALDDESLDQLRALGYIE